MAIRYLVVMAIANLVWEIAQLPFYTIGSAGDLHEISIAILHCTAGDVLIATASLLIAWVCFRRRTGWVIGATIAMGFFYTMWSEYVHAVIGADWAYAPLMPLLPVLGIGVLPLAQWLVVPAIAFGMANRNPSFQQ